MGFVISCNKCIFNYVCISRRIFKDTVPLKFEKLCHCLLALMSLRYFLRAMRKENFPYNDSSECYVCQVRMYEEPSKLSKKYTGMEWLEGWVNNDRHPLSLGSALAYDASRADEHLPCEITSRLSRADLSKPAKTKEIALGGNMNVARILDQFHDLQNYQYFGSSFGGTLLSGGV